MVGYYGNFCYLCGIMRSGFGESIVDFGAISLIIIYLILYYPHRASLKGAYGIFIFNLL